MRYFSLIFICFILCSCITKEYKSGVPMRPAQIDEVKVVTTKREVFEILGSPASITFVGEEKWFYYNAEGKVFAFLSPTFSKYEILTVSFDDEDKVSKIALKNLVGKKFQINNELSTELPSEIKLNFFEELFGNIGKFNTGGMGNN